MTYSLGKLDDRGRMFVKAGDPLYEGMVIGIHSRDNDLVVNAVRGKQLTNFRVSGKEDAIKITPPIQLTLEYAVEFIADDELVEITPKSIRDQEAPPEGARAQEGVARGRLSARAVGGAAPGAPPQTSSALIASSAAEPGQSSRSPRRLSGTSTVFRWPCRSSAPARM